MKAKMKEFNNKKFMSISLESLGGNYQWNILLFQDGNREPLEIQEEKKEIANKIIDILNNE